MFSANFSDHLIDKLLTISTKMKENSCMPVSALHFMSDSHLQYSGEFIEYVLADSVASKSLHVYNNVQRANVESPFSKNLIRSNLGQHKFGFSPHVYNFVNDSIRFLNKSEMLHSLFKSSNTSDFMFDSSVVLKQTCSSPLTSKMKETNISPLIKPKVKMSVTIRDATMKTKSAKINNKFNVPSSITLNLELANRKTKEIQKRSKKRRRRQKKVQQTANNVSASVPDKTENCASSCCISSRKCNSKNSKNENGFIVSMESKVPMSSNLMSSFVISVGNVSDNESDWDSCSESDILTEIEEFELSGLVVTNLNSPSVFFHSYSFDVECGLSTFCQNDEADETAKFQAALLEVNKNWNETTKEVDSNPKTPSKISFAPEDQLVEVVPVEICERKGEWETYAIERLRFKRRIEELEKIISPCLAAKHRSAVYKKIIKPFL